MARMLNLEQTQVYIEYAEQLQALTSCDEHLTFIENKMLRLHFR